MDNKKLLKFLYKDIAEIEELVAEKGAEGFDKFEIDFIQSRFEGAKQLIQILNEKEDVGLLKEEVELQSNAQLEVPVTTAEVADTVEVEEKPVVEDAKSVAYSPTDEEKESLQELSDFEEELKEEEKEKEEEVVEEAIGVEEVGEESESQSQLGDEVVEELEEKVAKDLEQSEPERAEAELRVETSVEIESEELDDEENVTLDEKVKVDEANNRLGDSFSKEKSVNELLGNDESEKLEYKISNSPLSNLNAAIGINDRYQFIRELFEGSADKFSETVNALDELNNINEAVQYLQQNHKWKKNEISLKFVNLVKRRFPNG